MKTLLALVLCVSNLCLGNAQASEARRLMMGAGGEWAFPATVIQETIAGSGLLYMTINATKTIPRGTMMFVVMVGTGQTTPSTVPVNFTMGDTAGNVYTCLSPAARNISCFGGLQVIMAYSKLTYAIHSDDYITVFPDFPSSKQTVAVLFSTEGWEPKTFKTSVTTPVYTTDGILTAGTITTSSTRNVSLVVFAAEPTTLVLDQTYGVIGKGVGMLSNPTPNYPAYLIGGIFCGKTPVQAIARGPGGGMGPQCGLAFQAIFELNSDKLLPPTEEPTETPIYVLDEDGATPLDEDGNKILVTI